MDYNDAWACEPGDVEGVPIHTGSAPKGRYLVIGFGVSAGGGRVFLGSINAYSSALRLNIIIGGFSGKLSSVACFAGT